MGRRSRLAGRTVAVVGAVLAAVPGVLVPAGTATAGVTPVVVGVPSFPLFVSQVDRSGRHLIMRTMTSGVSTPAAYAVDRLTGRTTLLPEQLAVDATGTAIITPDRRWVDLTTGRSAPAYAGAVARFVFADADTYLAADLDRAWVVDGPTGAGQPVPIRGRAVDISPNARFVLVEACADPNVPKCLAIWRWDRVSGRTDRVADLLDVPFAKVGDNGRVVIRVGSEDDGYTYAVSEPDGTRRGLRIPAASSVPRLNGDGTGVAYAATRFGDFTYGTEVGVYQIDTDENVGMLTLAQYSLVESHPLLSGDGSRLVYSQRVSPFDYTVVVVGLPVPGAAPIPAVRPFDVVDLTVAGAAGIDADATSVLMNVTVTDPELAGFATVWPCGQDRPLASNLNMGAGQTVAAAVFGTVGPGGRVCLSTNVASHVVVDVSGSFGPGGAYHPLVPARAVDTRAGELDATPNVPAGDVVTVPVAGRLGVPGDAAAVLVSATVTNAAAAGFLTVWPCGTPRPLASNLNTVAGGTVANAALVQVGAGGAVCASSNVATDVIVDVQGWLDPAFGSAPAAGPARLLDTRNGQEGAAPRVPAGVPAVVEVPTAAGLSAVLNVTVTNPAAAGYVTVWPCEEARPSTSNVNVDAGRTVANLVVARAGSDGRVCLTGNVAVDVVVDLQGVFGPGSGYRPLPVPTRLVDSRD